MIPCSVMDEHRDAYYHWFVMADRGYIPRSGNYLLHIDHHDDMMGGGYDWDLMNMPRTTDEALEFTDKCLGIADFIVPAIWQGLFANLHIVKNLMPSPSSSRDMIMNFSPQSGLNPSPFIPFLHAQAIREGNPAMRFYTFTENGLSDCEVLEKAEHVVLDVDLDYFCWDNSLGSVPEKRLEITREAYEEYMSDRSHPFRIIPKRWFYAKEEDGRCYLVYKEAAEREPLPSEDLIEKRIDRLFRWLDKHGVVPDAIDVCRSATSGYLPAERAEFTEECFMRKLREAYPVEVITVI